MDSVADKEGKIMPRLVDVESRKVQQIIQNNLHYITREDYKGASKYVNDPEEYDFYKILGWER